METNVIHLDQTKQGEFKIGDLSPALDNVMPGMFEDIWETFFNGKYYEPPVSFDSITLLLRANAHHESALYGKNATIMQGYQPGKIQVISRREMKRIAFDFDYLGNAFVQVVRDRMNRVVAMKHIHARTMRRGKGDRFFQVQGMKAIEFAPGEILHIMKYAPESSIYGIPEYMGAINAILLNEAATLTRRAYFQNGGFLSFFLYSTGEGIDKEAQKNVEASLKMTKGTGAHKAIYAHLPDAAGKFDVVKLNDFAKDEFAMIKEISRDDIISAHRTPPQILAVLTDNKTPPPGDLDKVIAMYNENVVRPIQLDLCDEINEHLTGEQQISFLPYQLAGAAPDPGK